MASFLKQCGYSSIEVDSMVICSLVSEAQIARSVKNQYLKTEIVLMQLVVASVLSEGAGKALTETLAKLE